MQATNYWVVIPAAGVGQRFGGVVPKQYQLLSGKTIIEHTLAKFLYHPKITKIAVAIGERDYHWQQLRVDTHNSKIVLATGGKMRAHSVYAGLQALIPYANPQDYVLVHDAVRPCINACDIDKLITEVGNHPVGGILGTRVRDTLKYTNNENEIVETVSRENIWQAQTPQMFRFQLLVQALEQVIAQNTTVTDEACAIEALGFVPMIVEGRPGNIKITDARDLASARKYL